MKCRRPSARHGCSGAITSGAMNLRRPLLPHLLASWTPVVMNMTAGHPARFASAIGVGCGCLGCGGKRIARSHGREPVAQGCPVVGEPPAERASSEPAQAGARRPAADPAKRSWPTRTLRCRGSRRTIANRSKTVVPARAAPRAALCGGGGESRVPGTVRCGQGGRVWRSADRSPNASSVPGCAPCPHVEWAAGSG